MVRRRDCLFVDKNHTGVLAAFLPPGLQQRRNRSAVVGYKRESLCGGMLETDPVGLSHERAVFPLNEADGDDRTMSPVKSIRDNRRDMFVEQESQHLAFCSTCGAEF